jgi:extracellular factor (EF) 3-hydroxypalmitic acid methyl ester biosynthesis protein
MSNVTNLGEGALKDSFVAGQNSEGVAFRGTLLKLTRLSAVFELYNPQAVLRFSESLSDFKIALNDRSLYSGKAAVRNLMNTGPAVVICEVTLNEGAWTDMNLAALNGNLSQKLRQEYQAFFSEWEKHHHRIRPEFKNVLADLQSFLMNLQLWLNRVELEIRASPAGDRAELERKTIEEMAGPIIQAIDTFIAQFESIATDLEEELEPAHRAYLRRQLHPLLLCSPFAQRTFQKPLGYAGDYEMVDMMLRPPYEGETLFAKIINVWLHGQAPATAHRNRITYLTRTFVNEIARNPAGGAAMRVFNLGCGPAQEVQRFLVEHGQLSARTNITLLDFSEETIQYTRRVIDGIKTKHNLSTPVQYLKRSVHQILKDSGKSGASLARQQYDYVYCAGLFDYLSDEVCKRLMNIFYEMLAPGGLLLATNVSDAMNSLRPFRYSMEYILDWYLIYRNGSQMLALAPEKAPADSIKVITENTGVNVFIEVRKPDHA